MDQQFQEFPQSLKGFFRKLKNPFVAVIVVVSFLTLFINLNVIGVNLLLTSLTTAGVLILALAVLYNIFGRGSIRVYPDRVVHLKNGRETEFFPQEINFMLIRNIFGVQMVTLKTFGQAKLEVTEDYPQYEELKRALLEFAGRHRVKIKEHNF